MNEIKSCKGCVNEFAKNGICDACDNFSLYGVMPKNLMNEEKREEIESRYKKEVYEKVEMYLFNTTKIQMPKLKAITEGICEHVLQFIHSEIERAEKEGYIQGQKDQWKTNKQLHLEGARELAEKLDSQFRRSKLLESYGAVLEILKQALAELTEEK